MKREDVKKIFAEATDEQLTAIMTLNGKDIENIKSRAEKAENELKEKQTAFDEITKQFEELKKSNATAQDWEKKYTELQQDVATKEKERQEAQAKAERDARITERFNNVIGDKKFSHEAVRKDYLQKFSEAISAEENAGKSDSDILHNLTKDDKGAFENITITEIKGANPIVNNAKYNSKADIMNIKDPIQRQSAIMQNIELFR